MKLHFQQNERLQPHHKPRTTCQISGKLRIDLKKKKSPPQMIAATVSVQEKSSVLKEIKQYWYQGGEEGWVEIRFSSTRFHPWHHRTPWPFLALLRRDSWRKCHWPLPAAWCVEKLQGRQQLAGQSPRTTVEGGCSSSAFWWGFQQQSKPNWFNCSNTKIFFKNYNCFLKMF